MAELVASIDGASLADHVVARWKATGHIEIVQASDVTTNPLRRARIAPVDVGIECDVWKGKPTFGDVGGGRGVGTGVPCVGSL